MSAENVSVSMFKLWTVSQDKLLNHLALDIESISKENKKTNTNIEKTNENLATLISLLREDLNENKSVLTEHIKESNAEVQQIEVRFKNLFQRQDTIDKILKERAPAWHLISFIIEKFKWIGEKASRVIVVIILAIAAASGAPIYKAFFSDLVPAKTEVKTEVKK